MTTQSLMVAALVLNLGGVAINVAAPAISDVVGARATRA